MRSGWQVLGGVIDQWKDAARICYLNLWHGRRPTPRGFLCFLQLDSETLGPESILSEANYFCSRCFTNLAMYLTLRLIIFHLFFSADHVLSLKRDIFCCYKGDWTTIRYPFTLPVIFATCCRKILHAASHHRRNCSRIAPNCVPKLT